MSWDLHMTYTGHLVDTIFARRPAARFPAPSVSTDRVSFLGLHQDHLLVALGLDTPGPDGMAPWVWNCLIDLCVGNVLLWGSGML